MNDAIERAKSLYFDSLDRAVLSGDLDVRSYWSVRVRLMGINATDMFTGPLE